jgi:hypothetical protein
MGTVISQVTRARSATVINETLAGIDGGPDAPNDVSDPAGRLTAFEEAVLHAEAPEPTPARDSAPGSLPVVDQP